MQPYESGCRELAGASFGYALLGSDFLLRAVAALGHTDQYWT